MFDCNAMRNCAVAIARQAFSSLSSKYLANTNVVVALLLFADWVVSTGLAVFCFWEEWLSAGDGRKRRATIVAGLTVGLGR